MARQNCSTAWVFDVTGEQDREGNRRIACLRATDLQTTSRSATPQMLPASAGESSPSLLSLSKIYRRQLVWERQVPSLPINGGKKFYFNGLFIKGF